MNIELISDEKTWDDFVESSPYGLLFHKWDYLDVVAKFTGYTIERYGIYSGSTLIALFPLFSKNKLGLKTLFSPPPQSGVQYLGFIMSQHYDSLKQDKKENQLSIVRDSLSELVNKKRINYVSVSLIPNFLDIRQFKWDSYKTNLSFTYSIDLSQSYDEILNGFKKETRVKLKKAMSNNLVLEKSDDLSIFFNMQKKRYREQGLNFPLVSQEYLENLYSLYKESLCFYYLYDNERNIKGSQMTHEYNGQFLLLMGSTKSEDNIGGNEFIIWELIKKAKTENYRYFDLVGANNKNLCEFKSQFNPSLGYNYSIEKKDILGSLAETSYTYFVKRRIL